MIELTLAIAWRGHQPGDTITVDQDTADWLKASSAIAPDDQDTEPEPLPDPEPEPETPSVQPEPSRPAKPRNAGPVAAWRAYIEALGYDSTGLTKAQMITVGRNHHARN